MRLNKGLWVKKVGRVLGVVAGRGREGAKKLEIKGVLTALLTM